MLRCFKCKQFIGVFLICCSWHHLYCAGNFADYVKQADSNVYFDSMKSTKQADGKLNLQFMEFSQKSVQSAVRSGNDFLALFPSSEVRNARELANPTGMN